MIILVFFSTIILFILTWWGCFNGMMYLFGGSTTNIDDLAFVAGLVGLFVAWLMIYRMADWFIEKILRNFFKNEILMWSFVFAECLVAFFLCLNTGSLLAKLTIFISITILAGFILSDFGQNKIQRIISRKNK